MAGDNHFNYETLIILANFVDPVFPVIKKELYVSPENRTMIQRDLSPEMPNKQNTRLEATAWAR